MVFANWKAAAVLCGLACAGLVGVGLVHSQQPATKSAGVDPNQTVKIDGEPCVILKTYRLPDGQTAQDVKILSTGITMMVVDGNNPPPPPVTGILPGNKGASVPPP